METIPDNTYKHWTLNINTFVELSSKEKNEGIFDIEIGGHSLKNVKKEIDSQKDETVKVQFTMNMSDITAWFPNGVAQNTQKFI